MIYRDTPPKRGSARISNCMQWYNTVDGKPDAPMASRESRVSDVPFIRSRMSMSMSMSMICNGVLPDLHVSGPRAAFHGFHDV